MTWQRITHALALGAWLGLTIISAVSFTVALTGPEWWSPTSAAR